MLSVDQALARILADVPQQPAESVPLHDALGRMLAHDLVSPVDVPPWDNSAMDGYALRSADTSDGLCRLVVDEVIYAGGVGTVEVAPGHTSAIMTGAPVPEGADAIVMVENTDGVQQGRVEVRGRAKAGQHIRPKGQDIPLGSVVLRAGDRLTPGRIGLIASIGLAHVQVTRRPVVAVLSTGDEVIAPGQPLGPGQIWSSNTFSLCALVREAGAVARDMGNAPDSLEQLMAHLEGCLDADVVLTTGGVSVGSHDFVKEALENLGVAMDFWKVAQKPGKPLAFGRARRGDRVVPVFGLPGNPVSCMVNFIQYARPWLRMAMGDARPYLPVVQATITHDVRERPGRAKLNRVLLERTKAGFECRSTGTQSSGALSSMAVAHGLLLLPPSSGGVSAGDTVRVQVIDSGMWAGATPDYGW